MEEKRRKRDLTGSAEKKYKKDTKTGNIDCNIANSRPGKAENSASGNNPSIEIESTALVELDVEIERQLEEKAEKSNLSAVNVKTILKAVITNKDVVEMVTNEIKGTATEIYRPKLTRSKTKELLEPYSVDICQPMGPKKKSECAFLLQDELPDEESDDEYNPQDFSDTESKTSEAFLESPYPSPYVQYDTTSDDILNVSVTDENIGQRTRSKLSLSETPLETIEQQFIPPDVTTDMYDTECDNEDWLEFLKGIQNPVDKCPENVEDENDPEYNIMKDEEFEALDFEELRHDRGVKVTKKELHNLMNEWFGCEGPYSSEDEEECDNKCSNEKKDQISERTVNSPISKPNCPVQKLDTHLTSPNILTNTFSNDAKSNISVENKCSPSKKSNPLVINQMGHKEPSIKQDASFHYSALITKKSIFSFEQLCLLKQQLEQHVQLLLQSFLLTYKHPFVDNTIPLQNKQLLSTLCLLGTSESSFYVNVANLKSSVKLVEEWESFLANPLQISAFSKFIYKEHMRADKEKKSTYMPEIPKELMGICGESTAFIYPLLLPENGCRFVSGRMGYTTHESDLIAFGLEEFSKHLKENGEPCHMLNLCNLLNRYLIPSRTSKSIMDHITVMRRSKVSNSIKRYFEFGKAPVIKHYIIDSKKILKLIDQPTELLPPKWRKFFSRKKLHPKLKDT